MGEFFESLNCQTSSNRNVTIEQVQNTIEVTKVMFK